MSAIPAKDTARVTAAPVHKKTRRGKKDVPRLAKIPTALRSQEEEVTPEEMAPVPAESASTEDAEDLVEIPPEGEEWPG
jgi:hypothetical protein